MSFVINSIDVFLYYNLLFEEKGLRSLFLCLRFSNEKKKYRINLRDYFSTVCLISKYEAKLSFQQVLVFVIKNQLMQKKMRKIASYKILIRCEIGLRLLFYFIYSAL